MVDMGGVNPAMASALQGMGGAVDVAREVYQKCDEFCRRIDTQIEQQRETSRDDELRRIRQAVAGLGIAIDGHQDIGSAIIELQHIRDEMQERLANPLTPLTEQQRVGMQRDINGLTQLIGQATRSL